VILVRPGSRRVEKERLALLVARLKERVVDAVGHDVDALRVETERVERPPAHELTEHDHRIRAPCCVVVRPPAEGTLRAREELWQVAVLDVLKREHVAPLRLRDRDGERVVNDVHVRERRPERL
jgi:hypothetical protein